MEEVVGSIPTRSTKSLNGLAAIANFLPPIPTRGFDIESPIHGSAPFQ
jgi:hypothetical protein